MFWFHFPRASPVLVYFNKKANWNWITLSGRVWTCLHISITTLQRVTLLGWMTARQVIESLSLMKWWIASLRRLVKLSAGMFHSPLGNGSISGNLSSPIRFVYVCDFWWGKGVLCMTHVSWSNKVSSSSNLSFIKFPVVGCRKPGAKWFTAQGKMSGISWNELTDTTILVRKRKGKTWNSKRIFLGGQEGAGKSVSCLSMWCYPESVYP